MVADDECDLPDVRALDATADKCLAASDPAQAMLCWERSLFLRQHYLGYESPEVWALAKRMCSVATDVGRRHLCADRLDDARSFLLKANALATTADEYIAVFNQLAAYYRRVHKLRVAYSYLERAMALEGSSVPSRQAAETRLNACAILSQLGRHEKALLAAQRALILLQEAQDDDDSHGHWSAVAVAYHNMAVEQEFLAKPHVQVLQSYKRAVQTARDRLGTDDPLTRALEQAQRAAESLVARKTTHAVFRDARAKAATSHHAEAKGRPRRIMPQQTSAAYGVPPRDASSVLAPKGSGVDLRCFDARALADEFVLPEPVVQVPLPPSGDLTPLLTPRREAATSSPDILERPDDMLHQGLQDEPGNDANATDECIAATKTMDGVDASLSGLRRLSLDMPLDDSEAKASDMTSSTDEKVSEEEETTEMRHDDGADGYDSDAGVRSNDDDDEDIGDPCKDDDGDDKDGHDGVDDDEDSKEEDNDGAKSSRCDDVKWNDDT